MSPEIQEWLHKSRSRINNLYLLTRPILSSWNRIRRFFRETGRNRPLTKFWER